LPMVIFTSSVNCIIPYFFAWDGVGIQAYDTFK
jgi:hypothetical protein